MNKRQAFRALVQGQSPFVLMEAHNGLSARIAQEAGFPALWASGLSITASLGVRDNNEISYTQLMDVLEYINDATDLPVMADGDTGYGNFNNACMLIKKLESRGIAAVSIEDKKFPKTNSFLETKVGALADIPEFVGKIRAMKYAQQSPDFTLVARLESLNVGAGLDDALRRAEAYVEAGADALLVHSKQSTAQEIDAFLRAFGGDIPIFLVPTKYYAVPVAHLTRDPRVKGLIWANHNLRASLKAMQAVCAQIRAEGGIAGAEAVIAPISEVFRLQGNEEYVRMERRFLPSGADIDAVILLGGGGAEAAGQRVRMGAKGPKASQAMAGPKSPLVMGDSKSTLGMGAPEPPQAMGGPKSTLGMDGHDLLERQLRALREIGIDSPTIVRGLLGGWNDGLRGDHEPPLDALRGDPRAILDALCDAHGGWNDGLRDDHGNPLDGLRDDNGEQYGALRGDHGEQRGVQDAQEAPLPDPSLSVIDLPDHEPTTPVYALSMALRDQSRPFFVLDGNVVFRRYLLREMRMGCEGYDALFACLPADAAPGGCILIGERDGDPLWEDEVVPLTDVRLGGATPARPGGASPYRPGEFRFGGILYVRDWRTAAAILRESDAQSMTQAAFIARMRACGMRLGIYPVPGDALREVGSPGDTLQGAEGPAASTQDVGATCALRRAVPST